VIDVACTVCRRCDHRPAFVVDSWAIVRCRCGHLYVSPQPAFRNGDHVMARDRSPSRASAILDVVERHVRPGRMLEIGPGFGEVTDVADSRGWHTWTIGVHKQAVETAAGEGRARLRHGRADVIDHADGFFDCVILFDVMPQLEDPRTALIEVFRVLRLAGLLVVTTPDAGSLMARGMRSRSPVFRQAPHHLHFFTRQTVEQLLVMAGFATVESRRIPSVAPGRLLSDLSLFALKAAVGQKAVAESESGVLARIPAWLRRTPAGSPALP
jgi:SAM-dependent methyltransferase